MPTFSFCEGFVRVLSRKFALDFRGGELSLLDGEPVLRGDEYIFGVGE